MSEVTRRKFLSGAAMAAGTMAVAPVASRADTASAPPTPAGPLGSYLALAGALQIPLLTRDAMGWETRAEQVMPPEIRARAQNCVSTLRTAEPGLGLSANDPYASASRLNAALAGSAELREAVSFGLSVLVDPNGFVDTAKLATGAFPESATSALPRLQPYPLG